MGFIFSIVIVVRVKHEPIILLVRYAFLPHKSRIILGLFYGFVSIRMLVGSFSTCPDPLQVMLHECFHLRTTTTS
jgi:hypothetical protein